MANGLMPAVRGREVSADFPDDDQKSGINRDFKRRSCTANGIEGLMVLRGIASCQRQDGERDHGKTLYGV